MQAVRAKIGDQITVFFFLETFPPLDDEQRAAVEAPITLEEVKSAIFDLHGEKPRGPVGITSAFRKKVTHCLAPILIEGFQASYDAGFFARDFLFWTYDINTKEHRH